MLDSRRACGPSSRGTQRGNEQAVGQLFSIALAGLPPRWVETRCQNRRGSAPTMADMARAACSSLLA
eukprot:7385854-Prymnesium_polylepis.1